MESKDSLISDFTHPGFCRAFRLYFEELGYSVRDWDGLFREMNTDGRGNRAILRLIGDEPVGFIQFCQIELSSWFFIERAGFVREFWVAPEYRGQGHGRALLGGAEDWIKSQGLGLVLLTTDTAPEFYEHMGYRADAGMQAKNRDMVYRKEI